MKKIAILSFLFLFVIKGISQEFMGVKPDSTRDYVVKQLLKKGLMLDRVEETSTSLKGSLNGSPITVYVLNTSKTKLCWKIGVYFEKHDSWSSLKSQYDNLLQNLTTKYGEPTKSYHFFLSPYEEGDGYEITGVGIDKCRYVAFFDSVNIMIEITSFKKVVISYENEINANINDNEKNQRLNNAL